MRKLRKASQEALDRFDMAAQSWGWEQDQGYGSSVDDSEGFYNESRKILEKRLLYLERHFSKERK